MADIFTPTFHKLFSKYREQERLDSIEHIDEKPTSDYLSNKVMPRGYPVVFLKSGVAARSESEVIDILNEHCDDLTIQIRRATFDSPSQYITDRQLQTVTMREYLQGFRNSGLYAGNQKLPEHIEAVLNVTPPSFGDNSIEPPAFWLGAGGGVTPMHKDSTDNFAYQICGTKRWTLFPVRDIPFLYMDRPLENSDFATSSVDPMNPNLNEFPLFANARSVVVDLMAGEMLYLPAGWAHHVENLSTSLMINYWMSRDHFARSVI